MEGGGGSVNPLDNLFGQAAASLDPSISKVTFFIIKIIFEFQV
jgi:hypothetical protein